MTDRIEPALSPEEWARQTFTRNRDAGSVAERIVAAGEGPGLMWIGFDDDHGTYVRQDDFPGLIALANAALPDTDPRKITREWVTFLREQAVDAFQSDTRDMDAGRFTAMANALESLLPPE